MPTLPSDKGVSIPMKYCFVIFIGVFYILPLRAQINLVKNPGLESYWHCPYDINEIKYANYWTPIGDTISVLLDSVGSVFCGAEYCNSCSGNNPYVGVPNGGDAYYHYPHSGNGMAEVQMLCDTSFNLADSILLGTDAFYLRDYIQGRLYSRLQKDKAYCVSFFVVLEHLSAYAINHIGAYLDDGTIDTTNWCGLVQTTHTPQVYENEIITDTLNWTKVQGTFISNGTEDFITIGNFFDSVRTDKIREYFYWAIGGDNHLYTWYLVDDVSVIALDAHANAGPDRWISPGSDSVWVGDTTGYLPCLWYANGVLIDSNIAGFKVHPTVITSYVMVLDVCGNITTDTVMVYVAPLGLVSPRPATKERGLSIRVWPNPTSGIVNLEGADGCYVSVYDMVGQLCGIESHVEPNRTTTFNSAQLPQGVYSVVITDLVSGERVVKRVIKE